MLKVFLVRPFCFSVLAQDFAGKANETFVIIKRIAIKKQGQISR